MKTCLKCIHVKSKSNLTFIIDFAPANSKAASSFIRDVTRQTYGPYIIIEVQW